MKGKTEMKVSVYIKMEVELAWMGQVQTDRDDSYTYN